MYQGSCLVTNHVSYPVMYGNDDHVFRVTSMGSRRKKRRAEQRRIEKIKERTKVSPWWIVVIVLLIIGFGLIRSLP